MWNNLLNTQATELIECLKVQEKLRGGQGAKRSDVVIWVLPTLAVFCNALNGVVTERNI